MKFLSLFSLIAIFFLTTACPGKKYKSNLDKLQDNDMNFPNLNRFIFEDISFLKPDMLEKEYSESYIISDIYETFVAYEIYTHFSVELFTASRIDVIQYSFDEELTDINAVHDNYVIRRENSLYNYSTSIKKEVPESVGFNGCIQIIHGDTDDYDYDYAETTSYFLATLEVKDEIYVFQMIGKKDNLGYLYDDFVTILSSIEL
tara:strand:+ start:9593 stop:10201 length:609 start_codon:yes stop_codon:yes gene_type:complete